MSDTRTQARLRPVIRVFVSSTFSDMKHERNALAVDAFPKLEQLCQRNGFQFQAIDLRWGVSTEAGLDHRTMRICFEELRRAQEISPEPNFLVLLGDRYGWRPLPEAISHAEFEKLATAARTGGEKQTPIPGAHGKTALQVLGDWYRCDRNVMLPEPPDAPERAPLNYILQPRTRNLGDWRDYQHRKDDPTKDTQDWLDVQEVLWRLVNVAFPAEGRQWLSELDWASHIVDVNDRLKPKRAIPQIARFQASATEQEIWCGALSAANAERHVVACFREITNRDDFTAAEVKEFFDVVGDAFDEPSANRQSDLKAAIQKRLGENKYLPIPFSRLKREKGKVFVDASEADTRAFCDAVYERLRPIIERQIEEYWDKSAKDSPARATRELRIEQDEHQRFGRERGGKESFVGRDTELEAIRTYLSGDSRWPLVIHGSSGCGKTALLWRAFEDIPKTRKPIIRLIGTTPHSSDLRSLLSSLCQELRQRNPRADPLPAGIKELRDEFSQHLQTARLEQPLILFLDALDQLADTDNGRLLNWLPVRQLPSHVKVVVSCLTSREDNDPAGQPYAELKRPQRQIPAENFNGLDELSVAEARLLVFDRWLKQVGRKVSPDQRSRIEERLASPACRQPIYLKLLFEEVQFWHSYDPAPMPGESVPALLGQLFDRLSLETNHGPLLVNRVLGYLSASRHGLAENEILEILFADPEYRAKLNEATEQTRHELPPNAKQIPIALWSRLRFDLAPYLTERAAPGANVLTFYHRQVAEWVQEHLAKSSDQAWPPHRRLADYFEPKPTCPRRDYELPWQLCECELWTRLNIVLSDPEYLRRSFDGKETDLMRFWSQLESHSNYRIVRTYEPLFQRGDGHADLAPSVAALLGNAGHLGDSISLWKLLWSSVRETSDLESTQSVMGIVGLALFEAGDMTGAMQAYEEQERICLRMLQNRSGGLLGLQASLGNQGEIYFHFGELDRALDFFRKQEAICRKVDNDDGLQHSLGNQGLVLCTMGRFVEARELFKLQERICQERGDTLHLHVARSSLAQVAFAGGHFDRALAQLKQSEVVFRELGTKKHLVNNLTVQGLILAKKRDIRACLKIYEEAEAICDVVGERSRRVRLLALQGDFLQASGKIADAIKAYAKQEQLSRKFGDKDNLHKALRNQAALRMGLGELDLALRLCAEAEKLCRQTGNTRGLADSLCCRGEILQTQGDLPGAMACLKDAETHFASINHKYGLATTRVILAQATGNHGRLTEALRLLQEAKTIFEQLESRAGVAMTLGQQGLVLRAQGRLEDAMSAHQQEMRIVRELNDEDGTARSLGNQAVLLKDFGKIDAALRLHEEEERISRNLESKDRIQVSLGNQAVIYAMRRDFAQALALQSEKEKICRELGNKHSLATSLGNQASIHFEQGHLAEAFRLYREEERLCRELENPAKLAASLYNQAVARDSNGEFREALSLTKEAFRLATRYKLPFTATISKFLDHLTNKQ